MFTSIGPTKFPASAYPLPRKALSKGRPLLLAALLASTLAVHGKAKPGADSPNADVSSLIQAGHWKRARAILEPQVKAHPQDARACYLLAQVKMALRDLDGALTLAQRAAELDPKSSDYHLALGQNFGRLAAQASIFLAGPLAIKFRKEVEIALELDPKNLDALDSMMIFKYRAPVLMGGDKNQAYSMAERITVINPSQGFLAHAELAELENNPKEEEGYFLQAVQANQRNYDAQIALAQFYSEARHTKYDEATKHAQLAMQIDSTRIGGYWVLARVYALQGRWNELERTLANGERAVPDDLRPYYEAAHALLETGKDSSRAENYVKKYLSQEPEGEQPDDADAHRLLGLIFEKEGRSDAARTELQTALRLRPSLREAKDDLKRLGG